MFLDHLVKDDAEKARTDFESWLTNLIELNHGMGVHVGHQEAAKTPSTFLDCYPRLGLESYSDFGGLFVRVWSIGTPRRFLYGIYLGAKVSKAQEEIRRGVSYARTRLTPILDKLEGKEFRGFQHHQWTDRLAPWLGSAGSKRAVVRQFDQFITFKISTDQDEVLEDIEYLIRAVDEAIPIVSPINEFAGEVVRRFFVGSGVPSPIPGGAMTAEKASDTVGGYAPELDVDWSMVNAVPADLLRGHEEVFLRAMAALKAGKHIILTGPPGTGKTELAVRICRVVKARYDLTTATSDWTTFDTIGGYLPDPRLLSDKIHNEPLNFFPGLVTKALERKRWLIIDEVNRADVDKAFGELFTLLSGKSVRLPYRIRTDHSLKEVVLGQLEEPEEGVYSIPIPTHWRMIGTMNTFDKASLFQLSYAFMRRFAFIEIPVPSRLDYEDILERSVDKTLSEELGEKVIDKVLAFLKATFAPAENEGLASLGLLVGPSIALDVVRYIEERATDSVKADEVWKFVLEALELYLYPQFEGKDRKHPQILKAIVDALQLPSAAEAHTDKTLSSWTGFDGKGARK